MTQTLDRLETYRNGFQALLEGPAASEPAWLRELRMEAWARFNETGFPTARRGNERWKYTNLRPLAAVLFEYSLAGDAASGVDIETLRTLVPWHDDWANLVFVDGRFSEILSSTPTEQDGVVSGSLASLIARGAESLQPHLGKVAASDDDAFTALNTAFLFDGAVVSVPDGVTVSTPINLVFISSDRSTAQVTHPRILVQVGNNARVTLVESYASLDRSQYFTNSVMEMAVGDGAQVDHYRLLMDTPDAFHVGTSRVLQGQDSSVT